MTNSRPNPLKLDPTRTAARRQALESAILGRLRYLKKQIVQLVDTEDAFGLKSTIQQVHRESVINDLVSNLASTQVDIKDADTLTTIFEIQASIDDNDLVELETESHITVRYGLHDPDPQQVDWIVSQYPSVEVELQGLSIFPAKEESPQRGGGGQYDVLKIDVKSKDLERIHRHLSLIPNTTTFPDYHAHLTIAYLKPGTGQKYVGRSRLEGKKLRFDSITYSDSDRNKTSLALNKSEENESFTVNSGIWRFVTDSQKVEEFVRWVRNQISVAVLGKLSIAGVSDPDHWLLYHIQNTFSKAMGEAYDYVKKKELQKRSDFYLGSKAQFLQDSFFRPVSQERVKLLAGRAFNELQGMTDKMATQMQRSLTDGFIRGDSPRDIARQLVKDVDNLGKKQARVIARTEVVRAHNEGQLEALEALGVEDVGVVVEWSTSDLGVTARGNPSPCPLCSPLKGTVWKIKEARGMLPRHPNCVIGSSRIVSSNPLSVMRTEYTGKIIEIVTSKGCFLSVTEHHVLLTQRGWIFAKDILDSDYLFHAPLIDGTVFQTPNDYLNVPSIEDISTSLLEFLGVGFQATSDPRPEYFHGDGKSVNSKIHITSLDSKLRSNREAELLRQIKEQNFMFGDISIENSLALFSKSALSSFFVATAASSDSFMGFLDISSVLFRGSPAQVEQVCLSSSSQRNAGFDKPLSNEHSVKAAFLSDIVRRHSVFVELNDLIHSLFRYYNLLPACNGFSGFDGHSSSLHFNAEFIRVAFEMLCNLSNRHSFLGKVHFNGLVQDKIDFTKSSHVTNLPVYDVETAESVYSLNGILSSNCMCSWIPAGVGEDTRHQKRTQQKIQSAIAASLKAERPKKKKTNIKPSSWAGSKAKISKKRPKSILED